MTREEAISEWAFRSNHIKKWLDEHGEEPSIRHYVELIDMAIEALSELSKVDFRTDKSANIGTEVNDLISRADAIEAVASVDETNGTVKVFSGLEIIDILNELPSAETHEIRTETHGVCLISKDDAMGAVQDHFNDDGFKGYDDGFWESNSVYSVVRAWNKRV